MIVMVISLLALVAWLLVMFGLSALEDRRLFPPPPPLPEQANPGRSNQAARPPVCSRFQVSSAG